ncbi:MAG: agmatinase family protein [Flavobacteriales bacterium]|nr:agmatinase family protein [Flavobacteriales bacterium]MCL4280981.1 agmatinase family protein [Flavobacteriales bacterium]
MSKASKIKNFDPNSPGNANAGIYGLPFTPAESDIVLVPVPWEVTTSYGGGTAHGPSAILEASFQVDLLHPEFPGLWKHGIAMDEVPDALLEQSTALKKEAATVIDLLVNGGNKAKQARAAKALKLVNEECAVMEQWVEQRTGYWLDQGKLVGLVGGDHSTPLGYFRALADRHKRFGILHLDAHLDLRNAYEGFTSSHASIMYNALAIPQVERIVSVGIRDFCEEEAAVAAKVGKRSVIHRSAELRGEQYEGATWRKQCDRIIGQLPQFVHISFDIDALDPALCPNTGTPVPGGLAFEEATYLLSRLVASGRTVIGFDLVEVTPGDQGDWDANVGARMLWHLCGVLAKARP